MTYTIYDTKNKENVGTYNTRKMASRKCDKLDDQYGGYRYVVRLL